jgi:hypothetical protein
MAEIKDAAAVTADEAEITRHSNICFRPKPNANLELYSNYTDSMTKSIFMSLPSEKERDKLAAGLV